MEIGVNTALNCVITLVPVYMVPADKKTMSFVIVKMVCSIVNHYVDGYFYCFTVILFIFWLYLNIYFC